MDALFISGSFFSLSLVMHFLTRQLPTEHASFISSMVKDERDGGAVVCGTGMRCNATADSKRLKDSFSFMLKSVN